MKRTQALITVMALVSMATAAQAAVSEHQAIQKQGRVSMLELAADAQAMIPAQWREDRFEAAEAGDHGARQPQQAARLDMIPAQWREERFDDGDSGDHSAWRPQQATTQDMIPAQWREDRFEAADAGDDGVGKQG